MIISLCTSYLASPFRRPNLRNHNPAKAMRDEDNRTFRPNLLHAPTSAHHTFTNLQGAGGRPYAPHTAPAAALPATAGYSPQSRGSPSSAASSRSQISWSCTGENPGRRNRRATSSHRRPSPSSYRTDAHPSQRLYYAPTHQHQQETLPGTKQTRILTRREPPPQPPACTTASTHKSHDQSTDPPPPYHSASHRPSQTRTRAGTSAAAA